ncbi:MAG: hypothetical protein JWP34_5333, partial [Massilia sp.]|nr:hypothetical protein [Massilia sp.]
LHVLAAIESVQTTAAATPSLFVKARIFSAASLAVESLFLLWRLSRQVQDLQLLSPMHPIL